MTFGGSGGISFFGSDTVTTRKRELEGKNVGLLLLDDGDLLLIPLDANLS
jgi:hypothetical protein